MSEKVGTSQACAACKYQRRKCSPECPLAPYFPPDQPKQFLNVHRMFGVSNILRLLKQVDDSKKSDAMKSMIYQANAREKDPVYGCFGIIVTLQAQVERLKEELEFVRSQVMVFEQQQQIQPVSVSHEHTQMPWIYPYMQHHHSPYEGHPLYRQTSYDVIRPNKLPEQGQQSYSESKEVYDSSAESSLKEMECLDHVADHELKSAAALFTLTNH